MPERIRTGSRRVAEVAAQIAALWLISWATKSAAAYSPLPLPGGALGLAILFALLCSGWIKPRWIEAGADWLVRHLGLFLVPYAVSFIAFTDLIAGSGIPLLTTIVLSTAIGIGAAGCAAQTAMRRGGGEGAIVRSAPQ